jgi:hypothetical protein
LEQFMNEYNILILSAGRRVELVNLFIKAAKDLNVKSKVVAADCSNTAPDLYLSDKKPTNLSRSVQVLAAWAGADDNTNAPTTAAQAYLTNEPILVSPLAWVTGLKRSHTRSGWALACYLPVSWLQVGPKAAV